MDAGETPTIQRERLERRKFTWKTVFFGFLYSRRREHRRDDDGEAIYIDWHHPWLFVMSVGIMVMSGLDAFLTLKLIDRGMIEANPVMASVMGHSTTAFAVSKMIMTAVGIFALVFLAKATFLRHFRTGQFLTMIFCGYLCLICWELVNLMRLS